MDIDLYEIEPEKPKTDADLLSEGKDLFERFADADREDRAIAEADILFVDEDEAQWDSDVLQKRRMADLPCLTINRLKPIVRQVVNDARQNKPSIKISPRDSQSDPATAEVIAGLIRQIEYASNAEVAYDTAVESAVKCGRGFWRVNIDYAHADTFDYDITIERIPNTMAVYHDVNSTAADSSDWNECFVVEKVTKKEYERRFHDAKPVSWDVADWRSHGTTWLEDDEVLVCEWWQRREEETEILQFNNGHVMEAEVFWNDPDLRQLRDLWMYGQLQITNRRMKKRHRVTQRIMSGAEILETNEFPGEFIPIVPVWGDEYWAQGKRHTRGLIHHSKDSQRMINYWTSQATALVALAPRAPWLVAEGVTDVDPESWENANTENLPYLTYGPTVNGDWVPPQRQPMDGGVAAGALQQAAQSAADIQHTTGIYNNSLGDSGNETSGRAINARKEQGDKSTFHFIDNLNRAIAHTGRIIVGLIPFVYTNDRVIRVLGKDGQASTVPLGRPVPRTDPMTGQPMQPPPGQPYSAEMLMIHNLGVGKYDVTVDTGPNYQSQRQESVNNIIEMMRVNPAVGQMSMDILARNMDWPGADELAKRFEAMLPPQVKGGPDPQTMQLQQQSQQLAQYVQILQREVEQLKAQLKDKQTENYIKNRGVDVDAYEAVTERLEKAAQADDIARQRAQENMAMAAQRYRPPMPPPPMSRPPVPPGPQQPGAMPPNAPQRPQRGPMAAPPMRPPMIPPRG